MGVCIQGLVILDDDSYVFHRWHGTLLVIGIIAFCIIFNSFLATKLPLVEAAILVFHIVGFFAVLIPLWVMAPKLSAHQVFAEVTNLGGWSTKGLSFMIGLLTPVYTLLGADSAVHMSEEVKDASVTVPRAIMTSAFLNGALGWVATITYCFCLGNLFDVLESPTGFLGYPFIDVFYNATRSKLGASFMVAIIIVNITSV